MKVVDKNGKVFNVTKKAFDVVYRPLGFKEYQPPKRRTKKSEDGE